MTRERVFLLGAAVLAAACAAIIVAARTEASEPGALSRVSSAGRTVAVARNSFTRQAGVQRASLLAVRGARAYYKLDAGGTCFGTGPAADIGELGSVDCPHGPFPTSDRPVFDFSVYEVTRRGGREVSLYRAEGFAADGVATVAFLRPNGDIALRVPVRDNVFSATAVPKGPIGGVLALDAGGKEVWRST